MPLSPGIRLGPYEIVSAIGAGGMGEVYLAQDTRLHRRVALKVLPAALAIDDAARRRLLHEARAGATLEHPNICALYDVGEAEGHSFIAMQYVDGETLAARLSGATSTCRPRSRCPVRSPTRLPKRTGTASSIATSSRRTSCCRARA